MFENFPKFRSKRQTVLSKRVNITSKIRSKLGIGTRGLSSLTDKVKTVTSNIRGRLSTFKLSGDTSSSTDSLSLGLGSNVTGDGDEFGVRGANEVGISTIDEFGVR